MYKEQNISAYSVFIVELNNLLVKAKKYKKDAITIKNNYVNCTPTFHLLSSIAFELFPKILIGYRTCLKYKNKKITETELVDNIKKELKKFNHKIDNLYKKDSKLRKALDIDSISVFSNGNVWDYRVKIKNSKSMIFIKDVEAIRYGDFASYSDNMTHCSGDHALIELLDKLEKYVESERTLMFGKILASRRARRKKIKWPITSLKS